MKLFLAAMLLVPATLAAAPTSATTLARQAPAPAPVHTITASGPGVATYPAFDPAVTRYGITTTSASTGSVTVTAKTTDRKGVVIINGSPAGNGKRTIRGLAGGDEISVIMRDSDNVKAYSLIYLPSDLHALERAPGPYIPAEHTLLTLGLWGGGTPFYEVAVDANGVPATVHKEVTSSMDFKRQPNGQLSVSRGAATGPDREGSAVVALADDLSEIGRFETTGLNNTDGHDSILLPDGSRYLIAYEKNADSKLTDSVIQHVDADGTILFNWNSADHVDPVLETVAKPDNPDYAHINSIQVMDDGDILASFRHFSAVFKIARRAHDGFAEGAIVWRFGGKESDFSFPDDVHGGPCAQHTASQLDNGHLLMFDNGAWNQAPLCVNPSDRTGDTIARTPTRITEYAIDEQTNEAHLVWEYEDSNRYAIFAGSAKRLPNGNTLVGWASSRAAVVSEINPNKDIVWELKDPKSESNARQFTYRADRTKVEDQIDPQVRLPVADRAIYDANQVVRPAYSCTDRGGSGLQDCSTTGMDNDRLDTSTPGRHTVSITGTDGAGNFASETRNYEVKQLHKPDAMVRKAGAARFKGDDVFGSGGTQRVKTTITRRGASKTAHVRVANDGNIAERFRIRATRGNAKFRVAYYSGGRNVTRTLTAGSYRTPVVKPGARWALRVKVIRGAKARKGNAIVARVRATSTATSAWDAVSFRVKAK